MTTKKYKKLKTHKKDTPLFTIGQTEKEFGGLDSFSADGLLKEIESEENNIAKITPIQTFSQKEKEIGEVEATPIPLLKQEVPLMPFKDPAYRRCPKCNKRVWKTKAKREGLYVTQIFKCKNKRCDFFKEIRIGI